MTKTPSKQHVSEDLLRTPPQELSSTRAQLALLLIAKKLGEIETSEHGADPTELAALLKRGAALHEHVLRLSIDDPEAKATLDAFSRNKQT